MITVTKTPVCIWLRMMTETETKKKMMGEYKGGNGRIQGKGTEREIDVKEE